jgi:hypothetical protein
MNEGRRAILMILVLAEDRIQLVRRDAGHGQVIYEPEHNGSSLGELSTQVAFVPTLALISDWVALWVGPKLLVANLASHERAICETKGDIVTIFRIGTTWCLVTELAVELRTSDLLQTTVRYQHGDVLLEGRMENGQVIVRDLSGMEVKLDAKTLTPVP